MADIPNLHDMVRRVADFILSLEARSLRPEHEPVLAYITDAVAAEMQHRKQTSGLARRLAMIGTANASADLEDAFYGPLIAGKTPVHVRCRDGHEIPQAVVRDADAHALLIETPDGSELLLARAIISVSAHSSTPATSGKGWLGRSSSGPDGGTTP